MATSSTLAPLAPRPIRRAAGMTAAAGASLLLLVALWLLYRRLATSGAEPASWLLLAAAAVLLPGLAALLRLSIAASPASRRWRILGSACITAGILAALLALSFAGGPAWALALLWGIVAAEEILLGGLWPTFRRQVTNEGGERHGAKMPADWSQRPGSRREISHRESAVHDAHALKPAPDASLPPSHTQHLVRREVEGGVEVVNGLVRGEYEAGQRLLHLHVAFCPPLGRRPQVTASLAGSDGATVKVAEVQLYGVRFDVRRPARDTAAQTIVLRYEATEAPLTNSGA